MSAIKRAVEQCGLTGLAKACKVSPQAVHKWIAKGVPAERVLAVEAATVDQTTGEPSVTRHDLRPDIYGERQAA
jgi:DNA-binding transcriptional regulator YdaS (Cro superfamily)